MDMRAEVKWMPGSIANRHYAALMIGGINNRGFGEQFGEDTFIMLTMPCNMYEALQRDEHGEQPEEILNRIADALRKERI